MSSVWGAASTAQNIGPLSVFGVGSYLVFAGLWAGPVSGASMNLACTFGPELLDSNFRYFWLYLMGPLLGAALEVAAALMLRGPGGDHGGQPAAHGTTALRTPQHTEQKVGTHNG